MALRRVMQRDLSFAILVRKETGPEDICCMISAV